MPYSGNAVVGSNPTLPASWSLPPLAIPTIAEELTRGVHKDTFPGIVTRNLLFCITLYPTG
jgi:hypothetical protein